MKLPTAADYRDAIQTPATCFADADLQAGQAVTDALGLPRAISGNFASVFQVAVPDGRRYAVRCFVRYADDQHERYQAIGSFLNRTAGTWKVGFDFIAEGIRIRGQWFPILKMEWVQADPLSHYIAANLQRPDALVRLATNFLNVVAELGELGAAHGDLQHGNVMVAADGTIRLIDYDGMYVPALAGRQGHEVGHRNYQHPARTHADFGPTLDHFSAWVIYASLLALAVDPSLWTRLQAGEEKLLFSREDYTDPAFGLGLRALELSGEPELTALASVIRQNVGAAPLAAAALRPMTVTPLAVGAAQAPLAPGTTAQPAWLEPSPTPRPSAGDSTLPSPGTGWLASHLPMPEALRFTTTVRHARAIAGALIVAAAAGLLLAATGVAPLPVASLIETILLVAAAAGARLAYARAPETRQKHQHEQRLKQVKGAQAEREKERARIQAELDALAAEDRGITTGATRASDHRRAKAQDEILNIRQETQRKLTALTTRRRELITSRQHVEGAELQRLQLVAYRDQLSRCRVADASIPGIGQALTATLAAHGIRTAADFTGVSVFSTGGARYGSGGNQVARIQLASGASVQVRGIGPAKARALDDWREQNRNRASRHVPQSLPPADRARIAAHHDAKLKALEQEEREANEAAQRRIAAVQAALAADEAKASAEIRRAQADVASRRHPLQAALHRADLHCHDAQLVASQAERALLPYRQITFRKFLTATTRGT